MRQKFDNFVTALRALCREHDVLMSSTGYDHLRVTDLEPRDEDPIYLGGIEDDTVEHEAAITELTGAQPLCNNPAQHHELRITGPKPANHNSRKR